MARIKMIEPLVIVDELKTSRLIENIEKNKAKQLLYDAVDDTLRLMIDSPSKSVITSVYYIDSHVGLIYETDSMEVIGFQVEAFQHSFIKKHASLAWRMSDSGHTLENVADLSIVYEEKKRVVARELKTIADDILGGRHNKHNHLVPA